MIPSSHAHPLSPPVEIASSSSPFFASSPSQKSDLFDPPASQSDALFPASPDADQDVVRRGSVATLMAQSSSARGIGLGLRDSSVSRKFAKSATRSRAGSSPREPAAPSPDLDKLPRQLAFSSAPHRLPPSSCDALPFSHLVALVQALSQRLDEAQSVLREEREELRALEKLAKDKGAGDGEIERVKVRARTEAKEVAAIAEGKEDGEWRIELPYEEGEEAEGAQEEAALKTEVDLDLEDLTEAISSNAFDLGLTPAAPDASTEEAPARSRASSLPPPFSPAEQAADRSDAASIASGHVPSTPSDASATSQSGSTLKPVRQRHASLSARFVGYIAGGSGSNGSTSSAPASAVSTTPASPSSATVDPTSSAHSPAKQRSGRSGSIRSVSSTASNERKGYGDWLGWRGWGKGAGAAESIKEGQSDAEEEQEDPEEREARDAVAGAQTSDEASPASTDDPNSLRTAKPSGEESLSSSPRPSLADDATLASSTTDSLPSSPPTSNHSTALSPGRRSSRSSTAPNSPTSTRKRSPVPPPSLQPASQQATAAAILSTPMTTSTISAPSLASPSHAAGSSPSSPARSPSPRSLALPETDILSRSGGEEEGVPTIKACPGASSQTSGPAFVPGVPLYSAPPGSAAKAAESDHGYVAAAKGSINRALALAAAAPAGISRTNSSSTTSTEPNLAVFPRLPSLSLSRYSPFAQPTLSMPATHVSLSASTSLGAAGSSHSSPLVAYTATLAPSNSGSGAQTMELDTISGEAAPPSLALLKPSYQSAAGSGAEEDDGDGPMIDRYGFIYDVRTGMELLKESRRRKEGDKAVDKPKEKAKKLKKGSKEVEPEPVPAVVTTPQTEVEVHPQLDALREAIGLTPTTEEESAFSPPPATSQTEVVPPTPSDSTSRTAKLVRAPSSSVGDSRATSPNGTGPQSMRALLAQLRTITDAVEKTQQDAWDAFIRKRQKKLAKLKHVEAEDADDKDASHRRERPKSTVLLADQDMSSENGLAEQAWTSENLVGVAQMGTEKKGKKEDWNAFKQLVRKGIPIVYRPKIWGECSSANEAREPGVYQELLAQPTTETEVQCLKQIDMDCHRTFPTCVFFAGNGPGVDKLRNVLVAYSRRNPKIGYCQGMNNLAATLLLTHPTEEDAFWVLVCIIENILPSDYYTSHLLVSRADQQVLRDLVERIMPKFATHLDEHGVELSAITFGWFLSLFTDCLPIQTLLRIWDLFFIHGTIFLFRIAVAILKLHEAELLACDSAASLYALLGQLPSGLWNADRLLKVACDDLASVVKDRDVSLLRNKHVLALGEELGLTAADGAPTA